MKSDYWHVYYSKDDIEYSEKHREEIEIQSTGINIHIDLYRNSDSIDALLFKEV
jgi:hypothetical protein